MARGFPTAVLLVALSPLLCGCSGFGSFVADTLPSWAGGLPDNAPTRPGDPKYETFMREQEAKRIDPSMLIAQQREPLPPAFETPPQPVQTASAPPKAAPPRAPVQTVSAKPRAPQLASAMPPRTETAGQGFETTPRETTGQAPVERRAAAIAPPDGFRLNGRSLY